MIVQRIARPIEGHVIRQYHRQLIVRHRHHAADIAVDHRDRTTPVALPAHTPVSQPPVHLATADAKPFQLGDHRTLRRRDVQAVHEVGVDDRARPDIGLVADGEHRGVLARRQHHRHHVQPILAREIQVTLIMARTAEDRARAVFHQHEVGDPHREGCVLQERVPHAQPGVVALLLRGFDHHFGRIDVAGDDVAAGVDERARRLRLAHRQRPVAGEDHLNHGVGIDLLRAEHERIDVA